MSNTWPKQPPELTTEQQLMREQFMLLWHQELPKKYSFIESFNHGFPANLPIAKGWKTLEVGAGIGGHLSSEDLVNQEYHCLEYREEFCKILRTKILPERVVCGDIEKPLPWPEKTFDRVIAIHVLEHLRNLPKALSQISQLLKDDGVFDIVIPCEGSLAYSLARKISAERLFRKKFYADYTPIIKSEHVNNFSEILSELSRSFIIERKKYFPFNLPVATFNLVAGFRLNKR